MLQINNLIGFGAKKKGLTETLVDRTTGTNIGNMTAFGGLAGAFDGVTNQAHTGCAQAATADGYVGKTYSAGKLISKAIVSGSNNLGYSNTPGGSVTLTIMGKNGTPASASDGTSLGLITFNDSGTDESAGRTITASGSTSYTSIWIRCQPSVANSIIAEVTFYELL